MKVQLSDKETTKVLRKFYIECREFWESTDTDDLNARIIADIQQVTTNPYKIDGSEVLSEGAKKVYINEFLK